MENTSIHTRSPLTSTPFCQGTFEFKGLQMKHYILRLNNKSVDLCLREQRSGASILFPMSVWTWQRIRMSSYIS